VADRPVLLRQCIIVFSKLMEPASALHSQSGVWFPCRQINDKILTKWLKTPNLPALRLEKEEKPLYNSC
jgi:hypothetical protein